MHSRESVGKGWDLSTSSGLGSSFLGFSFGAGLAALELAFGSCSVFYLGAGFAALELAFAFGAALELAFGFSLGAGFAALEPAFAFGAALELAFAFGSGFSSSSSGSSSPKETRNNTMLGTVHYLLVLQI
jgi:hypothetical protein